MTAIHALSGRDHKGGWDSPMSLYFHAVKGIYGTARCCCHNRLKLPLNSGINPPYDNFVRVYASKSALLWQETCHSNAD